MLVHLRSQEHAYCGQLDQVGGPFARGGEHGEISVGDAAGQIEGVLGVALHSVQLLNKRNHRFSVLGGDTQHI